MRALACLAFLALAGEAFGDARPPREPKLESPAAIAIDAHTGMVLFESKPDEVRPIASMTKLFAAIVLRTRVDLTDSTMITIDDVHASLGGAQSPLRQGQVFGNRDLLDAMMMSSDNRVPTALARSVGWSPGELLAQMQALVGSLGLRHTRLSDVTGLAENTSTARQMATAMRTAIGDRILRAAMTTKRTHVISQSGDATADYTSTIAPLWDDKHRVVGGKTGWSAKAGYCELVAVEIGSRTIVIALLGAKQKSARYDDYVKLVEWLER